MTTQLDGLTATFLASIATCLPRDISGDVMQGWNQNPTALKKVLREALCPPTEKAEPETPKSPEIRVWKRIKLGTGIKTGPDFYPVLEQGGFRIGDYARDMLKQDAFTVAPEPIEVDLVVMSVAELGFTTATRYDAICARAKQIGLDLCPAEVGPQLRSQYADQPKGEWLRVAMEAIRDSDGDLGIFVVEHDDVGRWLGSSYGGPDSVWLPGRQFVFLSRK